MEAVDHQPYVDHGQASKGSPRVFYLDSASRLNLGGSI